MISFDVLSSCNWDSFPNKLALSFAFDFITKEDCEVQSVKVAHQVTLGSFILSNNDSIGSLVDSFSPDSIITISDGVVKIESTEYESLQDFHARLMDLVKSYYTRIEFLLDKNPEIFGHFKNYGFLLEALKKAVVENSYEDLHEALGTPVIEVPREKPVLRTTPKN